MTDPQETASQAAIDAQLATDDAGIEAAAIALLWAYRLPGYDAAQTPQWLWSRLSEMEQRLWLYRARVACEAWERYWGHI